MHKAHFLKREDDKNDKFTNKLMVKFYYRCDFHYENTFFRQFLSKLKKDPRTRSSFAAERNSTPLPSMEQS